MEFAERLKMLRTEAGLTRTETARLAGCSREIYNSWESGRRTPSLRNIKGLSTAFDVDYNKLIGGYPSVTDVEERLSEIIADLKKIKEDNENG